MSNKLQMKNHQKQTGVSQEREQDILQSSSIFLFVFFMLVKPLVRFEIIIKQGLINR